MVRKLFKNYKRSQHCVRVLKLYSLFHYLQKVKGYILHPEQSVEDTGVFDRFLESFGDFGIPATRLISLPDVETPFPKGQSAREIAVMLFMRAKSQIVERDLKRYQSQVLGLRINLDRWLGTDEAEAEVTQLRTSLIA